MKIFGKIKKMKNIHIFFESKKFYFIKQNEKFPNLIYFKFFDNN